MASCFSFVQYLYVESRGWFWNKSHALNLALGQASGTYVVQIDADLIFPSHFLENIRQDQLAEVVLNYQFFYLPKGFQSFDKLESQPDEWQKKLPASQKSATGTIVCAREAMLATGGYDPFYRIWGVEDRDLVWSLKQRNISLKRWNKIPVFHQWHPEANLELPKGWLEVEESYFENKQKNGTAPRKLPEKWPTLAQRPALQRILDGKMRASTLTFQFTFPKEKAWTDFSNNFQKLEAGEMIYIQQDFGGLQVGENSRVGHFLKKWNELLARWRFSYRWIDLVHYHQEWITWAEAKSFLFYFILNHEAEIADYYWEEQDEQITLLLIKG